MNKSKLIIASMGAIGILSFAQSGFAADVRDQSSNSTPTVVVPSGAMSALDGSNGFDTVLANAPTVVVPSGAMSAMDGSNGFDTVLEARAPTPKYSPDARYKLALAECAAMVSTQQVGCRTSAQSAYASSQPAPRL